MFLALFTVIVLVAFVHQTVCLIVDCKLALAGKERPCKPTPRGRQLILQAGSLELKVEIKVV